MASGVASEFEGGDLAFLKRRSKPDYSVGTGTVRVVDLFAGGGGMTLGVAEACRAGKVGFEVALAVESDDDAWGVYSANFEPRCVDRKSDVHEWFGRASGARLSAVERATKEKVGAVDLLIGGPPCQGHSSLNNHTRGKDPKNALYGVMVRAAQILEPTHILIENVPSLVNDYGEILDKSKAKLERLDYQLRDGFVDVSTLGVPQRRKRHVLLASRKGSVDLEVALADARVRRTRSVGWAIRDLVDQEPATQLDSAGQLSAANRKRALWLHHNGEVDLPNRLRPPCHRDDPGHSYKSMYGRLSWHLPAQTITTGFGSPGQGRYLHPEKLRTLTPHEAARIQFFPDWFDFSAARSRHALAQVIGNAVPPKLSYALSRYLLFGKRGTKTERAPELAAAV